MLLAEVVAVPSIGKHLEWGGDLVHRGRDLRGHHGQGGPVKTVAVQMTSSPDPYNRVSQASRATAGAVMTLTCSGRACVGT
jgi:hypothetical protein